MRRLITSLALLAGASPAHAHEVPTPDEGGPSTVRLGMMLGALGGNYDFGTEAGFALDLRLQPFIIGVMGAVAYGGGSEALLGLRLGYSFALNDEVSLDLLGEGGYRAAHVGGGIMSDDPGTGLGEAFVGARVSVDYAVNDVSDPVTFRIGLSVFARASLGSSVSDTYEFESCSAFSCRTETATHEVGGVNDFGATVNLSLDFGDW